MLGDHWGGAYPRDGELEVSPSGVHHGARTRRKLGVDFSFWLAWQDLVPRTISENLTLYRRIPEAGPKKSFLSQSGGLKGFTTMYLHFSSAMQYLVYA